MTVFFFDNGNDEQQNSSHNSRSPSSQNHELIVESSASESPLSDVSDNLFTTEDSNVNARNSLSPHGDSGAAFQQNYTWSHEFQYHMPSNIPFASPMPDNAHSNVDSFSYFAPMPQNSSLATQDDTRFAFQPMITRGQFFESHNTPPNSYSFSFQLSQDANDSEHGSFTEVAPTHQPPLDTSADSSFTSQPVRPRNVAFQNNSMHLNSLPIPQNQNGNLLLALPDAGGVISGGHGRLQIVQGKVPERPSAPTQKTTTVSSASKPKSGTVTERPKEDSSSKDPPEEVKFTLTEKSKRNYEEWKALRAADPVKNKLKIRNLRNRLTSAWGKEKNKRKMAALERKCKTLVKDNRTLRQILQKAVEQGQLSQQFLLTNPVLLQDCNSDTISDDEGKESSHASLDCRLLLLIIVMLIASSAIGGALNNTPASPTSHGLILYDKCHMGQCPNLSGTTAVFDRLQIAPPPAENFSRMDAGKDCARGYAPSVVHVFVTSDGAALSDLSKDQIYAVIFSSLDNELVKAESSEDETVIPSSHVEKKNINLLENVAHMMVAEPSKVAS